MNFRIWKRYDFQAFLTWIAGTVVGMIAAYFICGTLKVYTEGALMSKPDILGTLVSFVLPIVLALLLLRYKLHKCLLILLIWSAVLYGFCFYMLSHLLGVWERSILMFSQCFSNAFLLFIVTQESCAWSKVHKIIVSSVFPAYLILLIVGLLL